MKETPRRPRAQAPFRFVDYEGLVMPTGLRAGSLREFLDLVRRVPGDVIYHHLHHTALNHRFGAWDYPNDFAQWAAEALEDRALAEKLAALDPYSHESLEEGREVIAELVEEHLDGLVTVPFARPGSEFHFASGHFLALPGEREAWTPGELREGIAVIPLNSLFYHFHEARLRGPDDSDDFSRWIEGQFGPSPAVERLRGIDFYFYSLSDLRERILAILDERETRP